MYRYSIVTAVTWRIITEIVRRHHDKIDFNLMELHPGGGQYDCLSLFFDEGDFPGRHLCDFNQGSEHFHIWGQYDKPRKSYKEVEWFEGNNYVNEYLSIKEPGQIVDEIEDLLGLPSLNSKLPPPSPKVLMLRLIANLLQRHALGRETIDIRSGLFDDSYGSNIREELKSYPNIICQIPQNEGYSKLAASSCNYWIVNVVKPHKSFMHKDPMKAVIDLNGFIYFYNEPENPWNVWDEYKGKYNSIMPIVNRVDKLIMAT